VCDQNRPTLNDSESWKLQSFHRARNHSFNARWLVPAQACIVFSWRSRAVLVTFLAKQFACRENARRKVRIKFLSWLCYSSELKMKPCPEHAALTGTLRGKSSPRSARWFAGQHLEQWASRPRELFGFVLGMAATMNEGCYQLGKVRSCCVLGNSTVVMALRCEERFDHATKHTIFDIVSHDQRLRC
jgi:hypothetical protein